MSVVADPPPVKQTAPPPPVRLAPVNPLTGDPRNFRVEVSKFGGYVRGNVLPEWVLLRSAGAGAAGRETAIIDSAVKGRRVSETYDPVNVKLAIPEPKSATDQTPVIVESANKLAERLKALEADLVAIAADRDAWKGKVAGRDAELGKQTDTITELQKQLAARDELLVAARGEVKKLSADVEALTAPKSPKTK